MGPTILHCAQSEGETRLPEATEDASLSPGHFGLPSEDVTYMNAGLFSTSPRHYAIMSQNSGVFADNNLPPSFIINHQATAAWMHQQFSHMQLAECANSSSSTGF
ncbi:hypothetical protein FRB94_011816 [Tulasnella sp. JGI-2019a]|nr:hypothetical protein FRB94_011816 [Tulasnella sp. JGI-2019a]